MKFKKHILGIIVIICFSLCACNGQYSNTTKQDDIKEVLFLRDTSAEKNFNLSKRIYIVYSKVESSMMDTLINKFVEHEKLNIKEDFEEILFVFFLESSITNENHLKKFPNDLGKYSRKNDILWEYIWAKRTNETEAYKYKNGKIIYPQSGNIRIEDIKD